MCLVVEIRLNSGSGRLVIRLATIMVVDDDGFLHSVFERMMNILGHTIVANAYNGEEAIEKYVSLNPKPDIILMDQRMPVMNGIEATNEILRINPSALIIFVSADDSISEETVTVGAVGFLTKPVRSKEIQVALRVALKDKEKRDSK